jgi:hypothetical protein
VTEDGALPNYHRADLHSIPAAGIPARHERYQAEVGGSHGGQCWALHRGRGAEEGDASSAALGRLERYREPTRRAGDDRRLLGFAAAALDCGSVSMMTTGPPLAASTPRCSASVVFPTPPFCAMTATVSMANLQGVEV